MLIRKNYYYLSLIVFSFLCFSSFKSYFKSLSQNQSSSSFFTTLDKPRIPSGPLNKIETELQVLFEGYKAVEPSIRAKQATKAEIKEIIHQVAKETNTPAILIEAICHVESKLDSTAFRRHDGGPGNHAIGLCQVLRKTGESLLGRRDAGCTRDFRHTPKSKRREGDCFLFDTYTNAKAAALYLQRQMIQYNSLEHVIAAYNAGSARLKKRTGDFVNRRYVNKVLKRLQNTPRTRTESHGI